MANGDKFTIKKKFLTREPKPRGRTQKYPLQK